MSLETYFRAFSYATIAIATLALVLAGGLHLALAAAFFGIMLAAWALMFALALRNFDRYPMLVLGMPVIAIAFWVAVVSAGGAWFGWTA